jgi:hypothetical protein
MDGGSVGVSPNVTKHKDVFDVQLQMVGKEIPRFDFPRHIAAFELVSTSVAHAGDATLALTLKSAEEVVKSEAAGKARKEMLAQAEEHMSLEAGEQTAKEAWLHSKREAQDQAKSHAAKQIKKAGVPRSSGAIQAVAAAPVAPPSSTAGAVTTSGGGGSSGGSADEGDGDGGSEVEL